MSDGWRYLILLGDQEVELPPGEWVLGRARRSDVSVRDASVSRRHAVLRAGGGRVEVEDLGSSNGTWVDGQEVFAATELPDRTVLGLGSIDLGIRILPDPYRAVALEVPVMRPRAEEHEVPGIATLELQRASVALAVQALEAAGADEDEAPFEGAPTAEARLPAPAPSEAAAEVPGDRPGPSSPRAPAGTPLRRLASRLAAMARGRGGDREAS